MTSPGRQRLGRAGVLLAGLVLGQAILFGPSLVGARVLLPLDTLALPAVYLPRTPEIEAIRPHNPILSDLVLADHLDQRFACAELRAGRLPVWNPDDYAGAPFAVFGKYSPFHLLYYLLPAPVTLAWIQLLKGVVAGLGAYLFFRRALGVGFWPAAVGAWCYPLTGFFVLWQGYAPAQVALWLPWVLLATDRCVRRPGGLGGVGLALVTCLTILGGQVALAGQVLLCSGLYALWCLWDEYHGRLLSRRATGAAAAAAGGWALGFLLSAVYLLPLVAYSQTGARMEARARGAEERPPAGLAGLPQTVLPNVYGTHLDGCIYTGPTGNQLESPAAAYPGLLVALVLAPLGWCSRRHRSANVFWAVLAVVGLGWSLNVPGLVQLFRLPLLNMLSANRFVFAAAFAVLATAVAGLDVLWRDELAWRPWLWLPAAALAVLGGWCLWRMARLPGSLPAQNVPQRAAVAELYAGYLQGGVALCAAGLGLWVAVRSLRVRRGWLGPVVAVAVLGELLSFAYGVSAQCDPALYYPQLPALARLAEAPPGRVLGIGCFPPNLNRVEGLRDVRGYDGVDPHRITQLLYLARDPRFGSPHYALTQWYVPLRLPVTASAGDVRVPPVLDLLGVRYLIIRGRPVEARPLFAGQGYAVVENRRALPRASVPRQVKAAPPERQLLRLLAAADFDPRRTAYVDGEVRLPEDCRGTAEVVDEVPTCVRVAADMQTPGLLLLSDQWYEGWTASVDGRPAEILRADYALRGVVVPAGRSLVVFSYDPPGLATGLRLGAAGLLAVLAWAAASTWLARRLRRSADRAAGSPPDTEASTATGPVPPPVSNP